MVSVHEAKTHLSRLLERAHRGEEIVITKGKKPYAKLVALDVAEPRRPGLLKGVVTDAFFAPLPEEELAAWDTLEPAVRRTKRSAKPRIKRPVK